MTTLQIGEAAPTFTLPTLSGEAPTMPLSREPFSLVLFVKKECPTCRLTLPFFGRLARAYGDKISFLIVTENEAPEAREVAKLADVEDKLVHLEPEPWATSEAYKIFSVPVLFQVSPEKNVARSTLGWSRAEYESLNEKLSQLTGLPKIELITEADGKIPNTKPG
jgi:thiol-disulfide isomerase/thioredoxin